MAKLNAFANNISSTYDSTQPSPFDARQTVETLDDLVEIAEHIEERLGRKLEYISGGATSSLMRVWDGNIPERINLLRIGEGILLARDLDVFYGYDMSDMYQDVFRLKAEVIEVKDKPTHPRLRLSQHTGRPTYSHRATHRREDTAQSG